jgi:hypothetical protein
MERAGVHIACFLAVLASAVAPLRAQEAGVALRGAQADIAAGAAVDDLELESEQPPALRRGPTAAPVGLTQPATLRLRKPNSVTRIGALPDVAVRAAEGAPDPATTAALAEPIEPPAAPAAVANQRARAAEDPYAPIGLQAGSFLLYPSISVALGYEDNPSQAENPESGAFYGQLRPRFELRSDWSRHSLSGAVEAARRHYLSGSEEDRPSLNAITDGRLDVSAETALEGQLRLSIDTEATGSDSVPDTALSRPQTVATGATLGVTQQFGRLSLRLRGIVDRNTYEDVPLSGGGTLSGAVRNRTSVGAQLRASYEITPGMRPFAEIETDRRVYDETASEDRNSTGLAARIGSSFELTRVLTGEASIGYGRRTIDDPDLPELRGLLIDSSLVWEATALTTLTLNADTTFNETTLTGASGSQATTLGVAVRHSFRRNLIATAALSQTWADFEGVDRKESTFNGSMGVEYRLSPSLAVTADFTHTRFDSNAAGADYTANAIQVGLRLQR